MKNRLLLLTLLLLSAKAEAQTITVPDANFRNFLDAQYAGTTVSGSTITFTTPSAASITIMSCNSRSITDLTGIAAFTGLTFLDCSSNQLTSLNVSANTALQELYCDGNRLTNLTLPASTALQILWCGDNQLTSLNVSTNTNLTFLDCQVNQLTSLDVSANTALQTLVCEDNRLTNLNLSANTALTQLNCSSNRLTSLNVGANTALQTLWCDDNQLTSLTLPASTALTDLRCYSNQLTSLNVSANTALNNLQCQNNRIPIILTDGSISSIVKDPITQVATFRSASGTPSVPTAQTGGFVLGTTGAIVNLTANSGPAGSLSSSTGTNPTIVGSLPSGIVRLSPDKFWTVSATSLTGITYNLILDLTGISGITNFNTLKVLKRANSSSAWQDVSQPPISATVQYFEPFILVNGLTSFSDFAIGSIGDNPLPVELTEFGFRKADFGIELVWTTASEKNNAGFEVQRRSEKQANEEWQVLGFVRGNGTTSDAKSYSFVDRTASGKVQYRLKQVDFDGTFEMLPTVEVEAGLPKVFALEQNYPNPFNPTTVMSYQLPVAGNVSLKVYDLLGREVATLVSGRQEAGRYSVSFNASGFASGVYFYRLQSGAFVETKKMLLVK